MSNIKKAIVFLAGISLYASAHAVPVFYSGTGNYYEYVSDSVLSTEAQAAAAAKVIWGQQVTLQRYWTPARILSSPI